MPAGVEVEIYTIVFSVSPSAPLGTTLTLGFEDAVGGAPSDFIGMVSVWDEVQGGFAPPLPVSVTGVGTTTTVAESVFRRGDANDDGVLDIADAVTLLTVLFPAGTPASGFSCLDAADANADGVVDIADPVVVLEHLFGAGGTPLPAPFPDCGSAPLLGCRAYGSCP